MREKKYYWDLKNALDTAVEEKVVQIVAEAIQEGLEDVLIARLTKLPIEQIQAIREQIQKQA